jgi:hypothetical protein
MQGTDSAVIFTCVLRLGWNSSGVKHPHLRSGVNPWNMEEKVGQAGIFDIFRKMALIMDAIELQSTYADNDRWR